MESVTPKILFAASEVAPFAKVGGLGDVIGSLPKAVHALGVETAVVAPRYKTVDKKKYRLTLAGRDAARNILIYRARLPGSRVPVYFLENQKHLSGGGIYFSKTAIASHRKEIDRFTFFSRAVVELLARGAFPYVPNVLHAHDWHTARLVRGVKEKRLPVKTIFTIHNLANQGIWGKENLMGEGIRHADRVTTVSPAYAKEIQTQEFGYGLEKLLRSRKPLGIINGFDYRALDTKSAGDAEKEKRKQLFLARAGLRQNTGAPLFSFVARLVEQKGIQWIIPAIPRMIQECRAQFVCLGAGETYFENALRKLAHRFRGNVHAKIGFDEVLAERIYAASDFFLIPSLFEPSGLTQMISMHYGTVPIARATGGLKDTIRDGDTGILFVKKEQAAFERALERAAALYRDRREFLRMRARCRAEDFSWKQSAREYLNAYRLLLRSGVE
ncbi:MAG: glycogen synthase [Candidatus Liptonbacteria bacterium]|nr:glycogen synthase [Candidatus Liptonbacteria bacterium]